MGGCCSNSVKSVKMEDDEKWNPMYIFILNSENNY